MIETLLERPKPETQFSGQKPDPLRGFVSESQVWTDATAFEFNSAAGFMETQNEDHLNPVLLAFTSDLIEPGKSIRYIRQKKDGRYLASVVIVEDEHWPHGAEVPKMKNYSLEIREKLQRMFDEFIVPYGINRVFKMSHSNGVSNEADGRVEYVGYELRLKDTDSAYVDLAIRGDNEAFGMVYEDFRGRIQKHITGILFRAGRNDNRWLSAEDITQETFIKAYGAKNRFVKYENVPVAAWLFRIATNLTTSHLRSGHFSQISEIPVDSSSAAPKHFMDENLLLELQVVGNLMDGLPTRQQQSLALSSLGYRDVETAWVLDLPSVNDLKVLKYKGRVRLREMRLNREERPLSQFYLITLAHRLLISRVSRGKVFWKEGQLKTTLLQSLNGFGFRDGQVKSALSELPEDFFDRLANIHTVPR